MNHHFFLLILIASFSFVPNLHAHEIRLYQKNDHEVLRAMIAKNEELLVPGNDHNARVLQTEKYITSDKYITQVCVKNGEPVGFITYTKDGYEAPLIDMHNFDPQAPMHSVLHGAIQLFSVQEKYYRQGIGKALIEAALEDMKLKKIRAIIVQTKVGNIAARSLYEKCGFVLMFPIAPGIDDCFYRLVLPA